ncbi:transglutaminase domain-containing protein [Flavobacterium sp. J27]|uniref:transglutaminase domain-containing protein n=1 Tax=Flavobacterium sp. J27 TaxID=2060419 RepID=UPI0010317B75|nr:transglutaminase domain-containing protein [Flavobacterium sp. J27]
MSKKVLFGILFYLPCILVAQLSDFKTIDFTKADDVAAQYQGASLESLPVLSYNLTNSLTTEVEKFRALYTWVCNNIENDYYASEKNSSKRKKWYNDSLQLAKWDKLFTKETFEKLKNKKKTVCTGYAYLIKEMSQFAGLKCEIINGYGRTVTKNIKKRSVPNHSWNAVSLNDKWYLCDATWSAGFYDMGTNQFVSDFNDSYFLSDPIVFAKDHYPLEKKWLLLDTPITIDFFLSAPIVYNSTYRYGIMPVQPETFEMECKKGQEVIFYLQANKPINTDELSAELVSGSYRKSNEIIVTRLKENLLEIKTTFHLKGKYDFHFKLNRAYLITYRVAIKK